MAYECKEVDCSLKLEKKKIFFLLKPTIYQNKLKLLA